MRKHISQSTYGSNFTLSMGVVKSNADPAQHGRLQIYIPSIDTRDYDLDDLPWANYVSSFGGSTADFKAGREQSTIPGVSSYGFWAIPKVGGQVLCGFMESDPHVRFWMGCIYMPELNRTLPQSIDGGLTEIDETGVYPQTEIPHYKSNLTDAGLNTGTIHYKTRGGYERSISHPSNKNSNKPTDNGYAPKPLEPEKADSQTICLTSPGRHYFVMSDVDEYCRIRLKTTEGSQIIFDDTNERIYISTAKGRNWVELDETNGKVYIYSDSKVSIRSKNDINMYSDENINIVANKRVNIRSEERSVNLRAKHDIRALSTEADVMLSASRDIHLKTFDGPKAPMLAEEMMCMKPTPGWIYRWEEKGGSNTSRVRIDAVQNVEIKSDTQNIRLTAKNDVHVRSMSTLINLQSPSSINLKTDIINEDAPTINQKGHVWGITYKARTFTGLASHASIVGDHGPTPEGPPCSVGAPGASTADDSTKVKPIEVVDHMIRPDHESWVRDEDESHCKTDRNKKYQG